MDSGSIILRSNRSGEAIFAVLAQRESSRRSWCDTKGIGFYKRRFANGGSNPSYGIIFEKLV